MDKIKETYRNDQTGQAKFVGQTILKDRMTITPGRNKLKIDMSGRSSGVYYLNLLGEDSTVVKEILITR